MNPANDSLPSLASYLRHVAEEFFRTTEIRYRLDVDQSLPAVALTSEIRHNLYLVVREALNNIAKHSGATEVKLQIRWQRHKLVVVVEDNGKGFDPAVAKTERNGLFNMNQRMKELGGTCLITTQPVKGCRVEFSIPLRQWRQSPWDWIWKTKQLSAPINETKNPQVNDASQIHDPTNC